MLIQKFARLGAATLAIVTFSGCSQAGGLGGILGSVLGGGHDNQTKVVYQNQNYSVSSLENGDQVTARVQQTQNGGYYTDYVQVDQSVSTNTGGTSNAQVQSLQGSVRRVDVANGWFELSANSNVVLTVSMPYNASRADVQRFQNLRNGDNVRF